MFTDSSVVNETKWHVAGFEHGNLGGYHHVDWIIQSDQTVHAGNLWSGVWTEVGENKIKVAIAIHPSGVDEFVVNFLSSKWFVATKGGDLYRLGKRH